MSSTATISEAQADRTLVFTDSPRCSVDTSSAERRLLSRADHPNFRLVSDHLHRLQTVCDERFVRDRGPWRPVFAQVADTASLAACSTTGSRASTAMRARTRPCARSRASAAASVRAAGMLTWAPTPRRPAEDSLPTSRLHAGAFGVRGGTRGRRSRARLDSRPTRADRPSHPDGPSHHASDRGRHYPPHERAPYACAAECHSLQGEGNPA